MWRWVLLLPLALFLVLFGLSNRHPIGLMLWPFDLVWETTVSVAVLLAAAAAFLLGALVTWVAGIPGRRKGRQMAEAARLLEAELMELKGRVARDIGVAPPAPVQRTHA